ncbi:unnamed protein product, partial [Prorocentrum cordatum]
ELEKPDKTRGPLEDKCYTCKEFSMDCEAAFGDWDGLCAAHAEGKSVHDDVSEGLQVKRGSAAGFVPSTEVSTTRIGSKVSETATSMNAVEFRSHFTKEPRGDAVKKLPWTMVRVFGSTEKDKVFIFEHMPGSKWWSYEVFIEKVKTANAPNLEARQHFFKNQPERVATRKLQASSDVYEASCQILGTHALVHIDDHLLSIGRLRPGSAPAKRAAALQAIRPRLLDLLAQAKKDSLNLAMAMVKGSEGVSRHHAEVAETKLRVRGWEDQANVVKNRLLVFRQAELLPTSRIHTVDPADVHAAAKAALAAKVELPVAACMGLLLIERNRVAKGIWGDNASFEKLFGIASAWAPTVDVDPTPFDPAAPTLANLNLDMEKKLDIMQVSFINAVVPSAIARGQSQRGALKRLLDKFGGAIEKIATTRVDASECEAAKMCEFMEVVRYIAQLLDPKTLVSPEADADVYGRECVEGSLIQVVASAIGASPYYSNLLSELTNPQMIVALKEMASQMLKLETDLSESSGELFSHLGSAPKLLHRLTARFPSSVAQNFDEVAKSTAFEQVQVIRSEICANIVTLDRLRRAKDALEELSSAFPTDSTLPAAIGDIVAATRSIELGASRQDIHNAIKDVLISSTKTDEFQALADKCNVSIGMRIDHADGSSDPDPLLQMIECTANEASMVEGKDIPRLRKPGNNLQTHAPFVFTGLDCLEEGL